MNKIIAIKVEPRSFAYSDPKKPNCADTEAPMKIPGRALRSGETINVTYSYSYKFEVSMSLIMNVVQLVI